jgi:hypothetical protein
LYARGNLVVFIVLKEKEGTMRMDSEQAEHMKFGRV